MKRSTAQKHKRDREEKRAEHKRLINQWNNRHYLQKVDIVRVVRPIRTYKSGMIITSRYNELEKAAAKEYMARNIAKTLLDDGMIVFTMHHVYDFYNPNGIEYQARLDIVVPREQDAQHDYEAQSDMRDYCERYEPTYNPDDGSM